MARSVQVEAGEHDAFRYWDTYLSPYLPDRMTLVRSRSSTCSNKNIVTEARNPQDRYANKHRVL
jgi:hypothetical protein